MQYLIRTTGGPHPGDRWTEDEWPLPQELADVGGRYVKVSESQLEEDVPGFVRGAAYEWRPEAGE